MIKNMEGCRPESWSSRLAGFTFCEKRSEFDHRSWWFHNTKKKRKCWEWVAISDSEITTNLCPSYPQCATWLGTSKEYQSMIGDEPQCPTCLLVSKLGNRKLVRCKNVWNRWWANVAYQIGLPWPEIKLLEKDFVPPARLQCDHSQDEPDVWQVLIHFSIDWIHQWKRLPIRVVFKREPTRGSRGSRLGNWNLWLWRRSKRDKDRPWRHRSAENSCQLAEPTWLSLEIPTQDAVTATDNGW